MRILTLAACAALCLSTIPVTATAAPAAITWEACPAETTNKDARCGHIEVPMDYSKPDGKKITVGFVTVPAKQKSRGSLFLNPGGPGESVYGLLDSEEYWPAEILAEWDMIAVQPRGLSGSTALECTAPPTTDTANLVNYGVKLYKACDEKQPGYAAQVNTNNTAEDWEQVRQALKQNRISILGMSYGTALGSVYATKYPGHTDKVVLDSGYNYLTTSMTEWEKGRAIALNDLFTWIAKHDDVYHMGTTARAVYNKWTDTIIAESGTNTTIKPPEAGSGEDLLVELRNLINQLTKPGANQSNSPTLLYTFHMVGLPAQWPEIARTITQPGAAAEVMTELKGLIEEQLNGAMPRIVMCNDRQESIHPEKIPGAIWGEITGHPAAIARLESTGVLCDGITATNPITGISGAQLKTKPLQIQATGDPNTPYWDFQDMARDMQSHVLTVEGPGHVQIGNNIAALDSAVVKYLRTGEVTETRVKGIDPQP
ncbi:MAG: alpha/beta hydrolase [Corynebacterium sp.]|nr:alpha/beta hydrolase [Corynebacterium sp.]